MVWQPAEGGEALSAEKWAKGDDATATEPTATEPTATEPTATEPTATEPTATAGTPDNGAVAVVAAAEEPATAAGAEGGE